MILTGPAIREQVELGNIEIDPFVPEHVNPASVDLTLGEEVAVYERDSFLDSKLEYGVQRWKISDDGSITLMPGQLYLMHTVERVRADKFVGVLDGKSSLARLGVVIHLTAGYIDPGFDGNFTLEVTCVVPVRLYAGMRVCQIRFHTLYGEVESYQERGNYVGERATGPVPSQSWRQFK
jgi:dCTP deaminase